ncbi:MAG: hypothetical protein KGL39_07635 [Patescibacteria group bacterium]|nr:hypothetical protein [Patescibacteria group bacterium]
MAANIFQSSEKTIPSNDRMIVRVDMEQQDIGGRKSHLPSEGRSPNMGIDHVPNANGGKA